MYDPVKKAEGAAKIVGQDDRRKYHRFQAARFYGGIASHLANLEEEKLVFYGRHRKMIAKDPAPSPLFLWFQA